MDQTRSNVSQSNKVLQDQLRFIQTLLDAIPHPVFYKDLNGTFQKCNGALEALLGMPEKEIIGRQAGDILPEAITKSSKKTDEQLLAHQTMVTYEITMEREGSPHHFIVTKFLYMDTHNRPVGIVGILMDITDKLLMERKLQQSQKMASIGQLAAGVAHEINNPTGYVGSNLKTLEGYQTDLRRLIECFIKLKNACKTAFNEQNTQSLSTYIAAVERLEADIDLSFILEDMQNLICESHEGMQRIKKIVEDLKNFAHPGQDKVQDTDINHCIETTLSMVNNELKYKATVKRDFGAVPIISANPQQLNQVFTNILVNAAQAITEQGDIYINTRTINSRILIMIQDTGCGISPEHLEKIFDPFFTTKDVGKGTGLGMNITYNIIKKHGGDIQVLSELGKGTTFKIELPISNKIDGHEAHRTVEK